MTTPESTEPRTAAQMSNDELIDAFEGNAFFAGECAALNEHNRHTERLDALRAELQRRLTIAPPEPGRVCLTWETACDMASWEDHFDMMDVERFREYISGPLKAAIAAAERAANGEA